tara:strand:- start:36291 stop:37034 length:744 start_codon:yes stop_codon:yes gene_type:complete
MLSILLKIEKNAKADVLKPSITIGLLGGNEFTEGCLAADTIILGKTNKKQPNIVILPTANVHHPDIAAHNGIQYFSHLGHSACSIMVTNRQEADTPALFDKLSDCDLLYLPGGEPQHLYQSLKNTALIESISNRGHQGMVIAGSSAGAMVMGELLKNPSLGTWEFGLGLIPNLGVIPHHEHADYVETHEQLVETVFNEHSNTVVYGISIESGCVITGDQVTVIGHDNLIAYRKSGYSEYTVNEQLSL